jgi:hypothetical protein
MTTDRALALSVGAFVLFAGCIFVLYAMLDVAPLFAIGPLVAVALASVGVFKAARDGR